jgi:hypothetical protein
MNDFHKSWRRGRGIERKKFAARVDRADSKQGIVTSFPKRRLQTGRALMRRSQAGIEL